VIRLAAVGDVHFDRHCGGRLSNHLKKLQGHADLLLIAGDLTQVGHVDEGKTLAEDLLKSPVPVVAVLGNHDFHSDQNLLIRSVLEDAGVTVLEKEIVRFEINSNTVGIVGLKGFGGGFVSACATDFGEPEMKAFVRTTKSAAHFVRNALISLDVDYKIVLMHYSPVPDTLHGEHRELYPFLGSYLLGEAIDEGGADFVIHGHSHLGVEHGQTPGGVPVRNVAQHVIRHVFNIYTLNKEGLVRIENMVPEVNQSRAHASNQPN
jgi:Icc-related predicted phosphoesterase